MQENTITNPGNDAEKRMQKDIEYVHLLYPWKSRVQIEKIVHTSGSVREALKVLDSGSGKTSLTTA